MTYWASSEPRTVQWHVPARVVTTTPPAARIATFEQAAVQVGAPGATAAELPGLQDKLDAAEAFVDGPQAQVPWCWRTRVLEAEFVEARHRFFGLPFTQQVEEASAELGGAASAGAVQYYERGALWCPAENAFDGERWPAVGRSLTVTYRTANVVDAQLVELVLRLTAAWWANRGDEAQAATQQVEAAARRKLADMIGSFG